MNRHHHVGPQEQASGVRSTPAPRRTANGLRRLVVASLLTLALIGGGAFGTLAAEDMLAPEPAVTATPADAAAPPLPVQGSEQPPAPAPSPTPQAPLPTRQEGPAQPTAVVDPDPRLLLPDLQTQAPDDLSIESDPQSGAREIRFGTTTINMGDGPLDMVGTYDPSTNQTRATQRIQTRDGAAVERVVGSFVFHPGHSHWHFEDFTQFELWSYQPDGSLDSVVATSGKMTFCVIDTDRITPPPPNAAPQAGYRSCGQGIQGLSVGWGDTYGPTLPGQELDISGVPDGRYAIRSTADPADRLLETDETNNAVVVYVEIRGTRIQVVPGP